MKRPIVIILVAAIMLGEALMFVIVSQPTHASPDPWWDSNWKYRRPITIGPHPENYQIKVMIPDNIPKSDYSSIRFLEDSDNRLLPYWIERDENSYVNVAWVRRQDNSSGYSYYYTGGDIWMYYHNPSATSVENGDNVFLFFDDFGGNANSGKWAAYANGGTITWEATTVHLSNGNKARIENQITIRAGETSLNRIIEFRIKNPITQRGGLLLSGTGWSDVEYACIFNVDGGRRFWQDGQESGIIVDADKWYIGRVDMYGASGDQLMTRFYQATDNSSYRTLVWTNGPRTKDWSQALGGVDNVDKYNLATWETSDYYFDWFFVRRYADTEPSVTVGNEQTLPSKPLLISPPDGTTTIDTTPTFEWTIGENANNHRLLVDNDPDFSSPEMDNTLGATDNSYTSSTPLSPENYSWKVIAINTFGQNESYVWTFVENAPAQPWTGTATIHLENLYKVGLEKDLQLYTGSKLVVKFYDYFNTYESGSVVENITPPANIKENENVAHPPEGSLPVRTAVKKAELVLTTDNENDVISTIASFTVHQSNLRARYMTILGAWSANPGLQGAFRAEVMSILSQWASAPS